MPTSPASVPDVSVAIGRRAAWRTYGLAVACVVIAWLARHALVRLGLQDLSPYLLFTAPIVIAAWVGGLGPGLLATALAAAVIDLVLHRHGLLAPRPAEHLVEAILFVGQGLLISGLGYLKHQAAASFQRSHHDLEGRIAQRTGELMAVNAALMEEASAREQQHDELVALNVRLEESNRELQDFASVASHDLQEPLRKIQAFGDRLGRRFAEQLQGPGSDYLDRMQKAAGRMQVLIDDLLTFSRVASQARPFVPVNLNDVAADVVSDLEHRIEQVGATITVDPLPTIDADPMQMWQLLQNLIGNALKFTRPGEPPMVRVYAAAPQPAANPDVSDLAADDAQSAQDRPAAVLLCVSDNGIGLDEKYLDRIFHVFQRLHGRQAYEGTGIGLAVCRKIATRHGGDITVRSRPGQGATFIVTLPVRHLKGDDFDDAGTRQADHDPAG